MSLIKCNECGKEISDKSRVCNECGAPIKFREYKGNCIKVFTFLMLVISFIVGCSVVYDKYFDYKEVPYCESGYELENGKCTKFLTSDIIGYECDDEENYYVVEDRKSDCRLKKEFVTEPDVTEKCLYGFEARYFFNEYTGKNQMECWGKTGHGYGVISPEKEYNCPEGFTFKYVTIGNTSSQPICIINSVKDKEYQISSKTVCPNGYTWQVIGKKSKVYNFENPNYYVPTNEFAWVNIEGCGKTEAIEPNYKRVHN